MTRKEFIKKIGIVIAAIFVTPKIIEHVPEENPKIFIEKDEWETCESKRRLH